MATFENAMQLIRKYEGDAYVNDPLDYGGETKCGIAKRFHPEIDIKNLTWEKAYPIYRAEYWDKISGDEIADQALAQEMLDIAVNIGWKPSAQWTQHALNQLLVSIDDAADTLVEDGLIGPKSIMAINAYKRPWEIVRMLNGFQFSHYMKRIDDDPSQAKFLRSWLARVEFRESTKTVIG